MTWRAQSDIPLGTYNGNSGGEEGGDVVCSGHSMTWRVHFDLPLGKEWW